MKRLVLLTLLMLVGCGPIPPPQPPVPPVPPVPQPQYFCIAPTVTDAATGRGILGAVVKVAQLEGATNADGYLYLQPLPQGPNHVDVTAAGYQPLGFSYDAASWSCDKPVQLIVTVQPFPPAPTRDVILGAQETFQGLTVQTSQFGPIPYYGAPYSSLNKADRDSTRAQLRAAGDTAIGLTVSWNYCGQAYGFCYPVPGRDLAYDLPTLVSLAREIVTDGFYVNLRMAGDGMSANPDPGPGQYNDPVGWTYGYEWLMANTPRLMQAFIDAGLKPFTVFQPGYDGVVPGWPEPVYAYPGKLDNWLLEARGVCGDCYLGVEFAAGYAHWGGEGANFTTAAGQALDIIYQEFNLGPYESANMDQVWQIAARHLGPAYTRGPGQPADDDPGAPFGPNAGQSYLRFGTPRGRYYVNALEFDTYPWVRNRISAEDVRKDAMYLRARGYTIIGLKH